MSPTFDLTNRKPRVGLGASPADLIRQARAVVEASAPAQPAAAPRLSLDAARQHAAAALSDFLQALIAQVDARQIVDADERIAHLSDEEKQLVATLIDEATAVVDCQFNEFEEGGR